MYDFLGDLCIDETRGSISVHDPTVRKASHVTGKRSRLDMLLAASGVELIKQTEVSDHLTFCSTQVESPLFIKRSNSFWGFAIFCCAHMPRKIPYQREGD